MKEIRCQIALQKGPRKGRSKTWYEASRLLLQNGIPGVETFAKTEVLKEECEGNIPH